MYIPAWCPDKAPATSYVKASLNFFIDVIVVIGIHALAAHILGIHPLIGVGLGGFTLLLHRLFQLGSGIGGACAGALFGFLLGPPIGACRGKTRQSTIHAAAISAAVVGALAVLGTIFLTYYIGMQICNSTPSLAAQGAITYPQALAIMGVALGLEAGVGSLHSILIVSRAGTGNGLDSLMNAIRVHPIYGPGLEITCEISRTLEGFLS